MPKWSLRYLGTLPVVLLLRCSMPYNIHRICRRTLQRNPAKASTSATFFKLSFAVTKRLARKLVEDGVLRLLHPSLCYSKTTRYGYRALNKKKKRWECRGRHRISGTGINSAHLLAMRHGSIDVVDFRSKMCCAAYTARMEWCSEKVVKHGSRVNE